MNFPGRILKPALASAAGLVAALLLLEAVLRLWGAAALTLRHREGGAAHKAVRVLCLGESTSVGYPPVLEKILNTRPSGPRFAVFNRAREAVDTDYIVAGLDSWLRETTPDIAVVMMGCNDGPVPLLYGAVRSPATLGWMRRIRVFALARLFVWNLGLGKEKDEAPFEPLDGWVTKKPYADDALWAALRSGAAPDEKLLSGLIAAHPAFDPVWMYEFSAHILRGPASRSRAAQTEAFLAGRAGTKRSAAADFFRLAFFRFFQSRYAASIAPLEKGLEKDPRCAAAWIMLSDALRTANGDGAASRRCLDRALEEGLPGEWEIGAAVMSLKIQGRTAECRRLCAEGLTHYPDNAYLKRLLASVHLLEGNRSEARKLYEELRSDPGALQALQLLARLDGAAENSPAFAPDSGYAPKTRRNYDELIFALRSRGIRVVCAQYPMQPLSPLRAMLAGHDGLFFVDNEQSFLEAVRREGYAAVFIDNFGGNFGHTTARGDELLAGNIAQGVLRAASPADPLNTGKE